MELYLDSANLPEIENAFKLGFLTGLTTTPTFMHREGYNDVDSVSSNSPRLFQFFRLRLSDVLPRRLSARLTVRTTSDSTRPRLSTKFLSHSKAQRRATFSVARVSW